MSGADFGINAAATLCAEIIKGIFLEIKRHARYVFNHEKNAEKLSEEMELLIVKRESVQQEVDVAKRNLEKPSPQVQRWFKQVDKKIDEVKKKVKGQKDRAKDRCFPWLWSNVIYRYQLSREAEEDVAVVDQLLQQSGFNNVAVRGVPEAPISAAPKNYKAFDSRKEVLVHIVEALKDPTISIIGVYGPGGVGKTTLVKEVARQVKEANLFAPVVQATVTETPNVEKIQDQMAESLGLKLEEKSTPIRASRLSERLKNEKKILIVLDDIWTRLDLEEVGICFGDQHAECKILLTSRNRNVLTDEMDAKKTFALGVLKEHEAWDLFKKMNENDFESPELQFVAIEVTKKCAGLPLAIVTIARALRNKELPEWRDALLQLQRPSSGNFTGIPKAVYSAIQLSYDYLKSEELKMTFLLSCLLGNNAHIQDLLRCVAGLHLFDGVNTVEETRNRVLTMVSKLKASCLLLDGYNNDRLVMHDLVWDVALAISSRDIHAFALRLGDVLEDWPDQERMEKLKMICLSSASIKKLPHELECPQLTLFSMAPTGRGYSYKKMPPSFFEKMKNIQILHLIRMDFSSSPSSISLPTSLRTLCLERCRLGDMASLEKLKNLEILSLSESNIEMLPVEIGRLTKLRSLDLAACKELRTIPPGVLSSLSRLEELFMGKVIVRWNRQGNADLDELKELSRLTTLDICILDADVPKDLFFEKLQRCKIKIVIGVEWGGWEDLGYSRTIKLGVNTSIDHLDHGVKGLLKKTEALYLKNLKGVKIVLNQVGNRDCFLHLSQLEIRDAFEIQYIMNDDDAVDKIAFRQLRSLTLWNLPQLISFCSKNRSGCSTSARQPELPLFGEKIELPHMEKLYLLEIHGVGRVWHKQFSTLENLTILRIMECDNLKDILSSSTAKSLAQLKRFEIFQCDCLREIIFSEDIKEDDNVTISFPQLSTLVMKDLEHFIGFCSENYNIAFLSLKTLNIEGCPKVKGFIYKSTTEDGSPLSMQALFDEKVELPRLEKLYLLKIHGVGRVWHKQFSTIENLTILSIKNCDNLEDIFSSSTAKSLGNLERFDISECKHLKEIIFSEDIVEDNNVTISFPQLSTLRMVNLEHFIGFCSENYNIAFPSLKKLEIGNCPKLKGFIYKSTVEHGIPLSMQAVFDEKVAFPQLEELELSDVRNYRKIWNDQFVGDSFSKLKSLYVWDCDGLMNIFPFNMRERLQNLVKLEVRHCDSLKEIFEPQILNANKSRAVTTTASVVKETATSFVFPKLTFLNFDELPKLKSFYSKKHTTEWPSLKEMELCGCDMVESVFAPESLSFGELTNQQPLFWVNEVSFPQLEELKLSGLTNCKKIWNNQFIGDSFSKLKSLSVISCTRLLNIFPFNMSERLRNLIKFKVQMCNLLKEIFESQILNANKLHGVTATPAIAEEATTSFVFPKLTFLHFNGLPKLKSFYSKIHTTEWPSSNEMWIQRCDMVEIIFASESSSFREITNQQPLFCVNKVEFPHLEHLTIKYMRNCKKIWHGQFVGDSFSKLNDLDVWNCAILMNVFSFNMRERLQNLKKLVVRECNSLEEIFEPQIVNADELHAVAATQSIVEETIANFVFPKLTYLEFCVLPKLKCFYSRTHTTEWPSLEKMMLCECDMVEIFASESLSFAESTNQQPLFWVNEVTFPNLKELVLEWNDILKRIWHGQVRANVFSKLRVLRLEHFPDKSAVFPHCFIPSLPNLEELVVSEAAFSQIFNLEGVGGNEIDALALTSLNELRLAKLPQLTHLWKKEYNLSRAFWNLRSLAVEGCGKLKNLLTCSVAKSLVQLTSMTVNNCEMIEEIIACECDEVKGGLVFTQLKHLQLRSLLSLTSFCSGKHSFEFPALKYVSVIGCPEMKIFSQRDLSTPMLQRVQFIRSEYEGCWEGNLNTTIQWMFAEKVRNPGVEHLILSESSKSMGIWRRIAQGISDFKCLKSLEVHDCSTLTCLFSLSIALDLPQLCEIKVKNCIVMKHIIIDEGPDEELENKIVFPQLRSVTLVSCEDLASFYQGIKMLECPSLKKLEVLDCPRIFAFASTFSTEQRIETIDDGGNTISLSKRAADVIDAAFFNNMVAFPQLKKLVIRGSINCRKLWHDQLISDSFSKLKSFCMLDCDGLLNVFPFHMSRRLQNLKEFVVYECNSLEEIFEPSLLNADELHAATASESIVLTNLKHLYLCYLPSLASFCSGKHNFEFPALKNVVVSECPKMKIFCQGDLSAPQLQKVISVTAEDVNEDEAIWWWEGNLNTTIQRLFEEMNVQQS